MMLIASTVSPYHDRHQALATLLGQLGQSVAEADEGAPDWASFVMQGPETVRGHRGTTWFVWTATVATLGRSCSRP